MEKPKLTRTNKPQRPPLHKYIRGEAKLEDLVCRNKIIVPDQSRTNRRAILASVNSIGKSTSSSNQSQPRKTDQTLSLARHGHPHFSSGSSSDKSRRKLEKKDDQTPSERPRITMSSSSLGESAHSAQGDMTESKARTLSSCSTRASVFVDRALNDKENEIHRLTAEIENLKQISKVRREQEMVSLLQKLLEDLPFDDHQRLIESSDNVDILAERLHNAIRTLRESHENFLQINAEKEEKLAEVNIKNDLLQKRIENLQSDVQKVNDMNKAHTHQLVNFQTQNERLRVNLESMRRVHTSGIEMCGALQLFIQDKFPNETHQLRSFEKRLHERVKQLEQELEKLDTVCRRHISWSEGSEQIEDLKSKLQETELERIQQVCEVTTHYEQEKRNNKLFETLIVKLSSENRSLKNDNQYLRQKNEALEEVCQKKLESLTSPLKQQTLAKFNRKSLDAEIAYSQELIKLTDETIRVTQGPNDH